MKRASLLIFALASVSAFATDIYVEGFETMTNGQTLASYANPNNASLWQANANVKASTAQAHGGTKSVTRDYSLTTTGTGGDIWNVLNAPLASTDVVVGSCWWYLNQNNASPTQLQFLRPSLREYAYDSTIADNPFIGTVAVYTIEDTTGMNDRGRVYMGIPTTSTGYSHFANKPVFAPMNGWFKVQFIMDYRTGYFRANMNGQDLGMTYKWNDAANPSARFPLPDYGMQTVQPLRYKWSGTAWALDATATDWSLFFDDYSVEKFTAKPITGNVSFGGFVGHAGEAVAGTWVYISLVDGSGNTVEEGTAELDASGNFDYSTLVPDGTYSVRVKGYKWLSEMNGGVAVSSAGASAGSFTLRSGDCDDSNIIDIADYTQLALAFDGVYDDGTGTSSANWDFAADCNADGIVDIADYTILALNFDGVGN